MVKRLIIFLTSLLTLFFLSSCIGDANIYKLISVYDNQAFQPNDSIEVKQNTTFNLLSISPDYDGYITINYNPPEDYNMLKKLSNEDSALLIEYINYLARTGRLESYLNSELDENTRSLTKNTTAFVRGIIDNVGNYALSILRDVSQIYDGLYTEEDLKVFEDFFESLKDTVIEDPKTVKDYLAIQLSLDAIASVIQIIHEIIIGLPSEIINYDWDSLESEVFSSEDLLKIISGKATEIVSILVNALTEIDMIGSRIPGFFNLSEIIKLVFQGSEEAAS